MRNQLSTLELGQPLAHRPIVRTTHTEKNTAASGNTAINQGGTKRCPTAAVGEDRKNLHVGIRTIASKMSNGYARAEKTARRNSAPAPLTHAQIIQGNPAEERAGNRGNKAEPEGEEQFPGPMPPRRNMTAEATSNGSGRLSATRTVPILPFATSGGRWTESPSAFLPRRRR